MIPEFPVFKHIELSDKEEVENFTNKFNPYSDFNFTSLWLWDTDKEMMISKSNGNLIVLFSDYVTNKPFLSFIGEKDVVDTSFSLIKFSEEKYNTNYLKFIPEEVANTLPTSKFLITADKDSFDYIYYIPDLAEMGSIWDKTFGKETRHFIEDHPDYIVKEYSIMEAPKLECEILFHKWADNKHIDNFFEINEYKAFEKLFKLNCENIRVICLYVDGTLVGFTVYEILPNNFVMSHFAKADLTCHKAVNSVLNMEEARNLKSKGMKHFNWEQDLGIPGLRESKEKYKPCFFLEKFIVKLV